MPCNAAAPGLVVWDWNGTLLNDQLATFMATRRALVDLGYPVISLAEYRKALAWPMNDTYNSLLGTQLSVEELAMISARFRHCYAMAEDRLALHGEADVAIDEISNSGRRQIILSMSDQGQLNLSVSRLNLEGHFDAIYGMGQIYARKAQAICHIPELARQPTRRVFLIGDTVEDFNAATAIGACPILFDGGAQPVSKLKATGALVVDSLLMAARSVIDADRATFSDSARTEHER